MKSERFWNVYLGKKHIDLVKADCAEDACTIADLMFGSPSRYSHEYIKYNAVEFKPAIHTMVVYGDGTWLIERKDE